MHYDHADTVCLSINGIGCLLPVDVCIFMSTGPVDTSLAIGVLEVQRSKLLALSALYLLTKQ